MSLNVTQISIVAAIGAVVSYFVQEALSRQKAQTVTPLSSSPPPNSGSQWTGTGRIKSLQKTPQNSTLTAAPGKQGTHDWFNGQIVVHGWNAGSNSNAGGAQGEQSYAFQSWSKNPFNNGTNSSYRSAVDNATRDPTNAATSLVLGPGLAPND